MNIKNIKIYSNDLEQTLLVRKKLEKVIKNKFNITDKNPDLIIAIGGDGTFISALRDNKFDRRPLYVGINTGHLGFLQEINISQIFEFFYAITENNFKVEELSLAKLKVESEQTNYNFLALNEIVVREKKLKVLHTLVNINDSCLESFSGDGIIISTPTGSSAYNLSAGGSIIYPSLKMLQITPLAPLNSKSYRSLNNSVIVPENMTITLIPEEIHKDNILISIDGENLELSSIKKINITTDKRGIKVLRFDHYDFWSRIKEKFL